MTVSSSSEGWAGASVTLACESSRTTHPLPPRAVWRVERPRVHLGSAKAEGVHFLPVPVLTCLPTKTPVPISTLSRSSTTLQGLCFHNTNHYRFSKFRKFFKKLTSQGKLLRHAASHFFCPKCDFGKGEKHIKCQPKEAGAQGILDQELEDRAGSSLSTPDLSLWAVVGTVAGSTAALPSPGDKQKCLRTLQTAPGEQNWLR